MADFYKDGIIGLVDEMSEEQLDLLYTLMRKFAGVNHNV